MRIQHRIGLLTGHDIGRYRSAAALQPFLRSGFCVGCHSTPKIGGVCEIRQRLLVEHDVAKDALLHIVIEICGEFRVPDVEIARRIEQPGAIDKAIATIVEFARHDEHGFGGTR